MCCSIPRCSWGRNDLRRTLEKETQAQELMAQNWAPAWPEQHEWVLLWMLKYRLVWVHAGQSSEYIKTCWISAAQSPTRLSWTQAVVISEVWSAAGGLQPGSDHSSCGVPQGCPLSAPSALCAPSPGCSFSATVHLRNIPTPLVPSQQVHSHSIVSSCSAFAGTVHLLQPGSLCLHWPLERWSPFTCAAAAAFQHWWVWKPVTLSLTPL